MIKKMSMRDMLTSHRNYMEVTVRIEQVEAGWWAATCEEMPGLFLTHEVRDEVIDSIPESIALIAKLQWGEIIEPVLAPVAVKVEASSTLLHTYKLVPNVKKSLEVLKLNSKYINGEIRPAFHGTSLERYESILKNGFKAGTFFAFDIGESRCHGDYIFEAHFDWNEKMTIQDANWQFVIEDMLPKERIKNTYKSIKEI